MKLEEAVEKICPDDKVVQKIILKRAKKSAYVSRSIVNGDVADVDSFYSALGSNLYFASLKWKRNIIANIKKELKELRGGDLVKQEPKKHELKEFPKRKYKRGNNPAINSKKELLDMYINAVAENKRKTGLESKPEKNHAKLIAKNSEKFIAKFMKFDENKIPAEKIVDRKYIESGDAEISIKLGLKYLEKEYGKRMSKEDFLELKIGYVCRNSIDQGISTGLFDIVKNYNNSLKEITIETKTNGEWIEERGVSKFKYERSRRVVPKGKARVS